VQLAFAHSEATSRYDLNRVEMHVSNHQLNGRKSVVINADAAEFLLVSARSGGEVDERSGIALYLVPADSAGITRFSYDLTGGGQAADLIFENVQLSEHELLSTNALTAIEQANAAAIVAQCAETLGAMETATSMTWPGLP